MAAATIKQLRANEVPKFIRRAKSADSKYIVKIRVTHVYVDISHDGMETVDEFLDLRIVKSATTLLLADIGVVSPTKVVINA